MPNPSNLYVCPRCLYSCTKRWMMKRHLLESIRPCPGKTGIILNPEIIDHVLDNHVYVPKPEEPVAPQNNHAPSGPVCPRLSQTFNNYNTINAVVSNMESLEKVKMITDHQGIRQIDFEDRLEQDFQYRLERLEQDGFKGGYCLNHEGLLKLVDGATKMEDNDLNQFNILFDKTLNRVKILSCGKWDSYLEEIGIKEVIRLLKSYFLDSYELYLIKNLHGTDSKKNRFAMRDHLDVYYKFISTFDLDAVVCSQSDEVILGYNVKENNEYYLAEHYGKIYRDLKRDTKISEKNKIKRTITNIIKENTTHNLNKLNKIMLDLLKTDEEFLSQLVETRQFPATLATKY